MNIVQPIAAVCAMVITAASMFGIATYSDHVTATQRTVHATQAHANPITLPTIEVRPTRKQLQQAAAADTHDASQHAIDARMPYYSFAGNQVGT